MTLLSWKEKMLTTEGILGKRPCKEYDEWRSGRGEEGKLLFGNIGYRRKYFPRK